MSRGLLAIVIALLAISACSQVRDDGSKVLVLWITETAGSKLAQNGSIPGKMKFSGPPEISATVLADRLMRCGVTTYTVQFASHAEYVFTESTPKDAELVRCVQAKVDFAFSAGIGSPDNLEEADQTPFQALRG